VLKLPLTSDLTTLLRGAPQFAAIMSADAEEHVIADATNNMPASMPRADERPINPNPKFKPSPSVLRRSAAKNADRIPAGETKHSINGNNSIIP
jgi:hypothetical protein